MILMCSLRLRRLVSIAGMIAAACLMNRECLALVPSLEGQLIISANQRFMGLVHTVMKKEITVFELRNSERIEKWKAPLTLVATALHLSDDGEFVVTEEDFPSSDRFFHLIHTGAVVRVITGSDILATVPKGSLGAEPISDVILPSRSKVPQQLGMITSAAGIGCYALWLAGTADWRAWSLRDGQLIEVTPALVEQWEREAEPLASRAVALMRAKPQYRHEPILGHPEDQKTPGAQRYYPAADSAYLFLARRKTAEDRKMLERLLHEDIAFRTDTFVDERLLGVAATCFWRDFGDELLAEFDGVPRKYGRFGGSRYLGGVDGEIQLGDSPTANDGCLWIILLSAELANQWRSHPVPECARVVFSKEASWERSENAPDQLPSRIAYSFRQILPGRYVVKVLWRKGAKDPIPTWPGAAQEGDVEYAGEPITVTVRPQMIAEVQPTE